MIRKSKLCKFVHLCAVALVFVISGCTTTTSNQSDVEEVKVVDVATQNVDINTSENVITSEANTPSTPKKLAAEFYPGTGRFTARPGVSASSDSATGDIIYFYVCYISLFTSSCTSTNNEDKCNST